MTYNNLQLPKFLYTLSSKTSLQLTNMLFKKFLATAVAFLLGATEVAAVTHGEVTDYNGGQVKWHQLGKGMWSGIPIDEWDDSGELSQKGPCPIIVH